jgi:hypothetical protein
LEGCAAGRVGATEAHYNPVVPLQCNIDSRGKAARLIYGLVLLAAGVAMLVWWALPGGGVVAWVLTAVAILGGAFAVFEARAGWCVVRAMGFKTPL